MTIWRDIPGYEHAYEVSDTGIVRSKARYAPRRDGVRQTYPLRVMTQTPGKHGHLSVSLSKDYRASKHYIHRLVLLAFVGESELEVRHLDGDPANNALSNIVYGTHTENMHDKRLHGTEYQSLRTHCKAGHKFSAPKNGRRVCRPCANRRNKVYKKKLNMPY